MLHTVGSQRRARQAIHGVQVARTRAAFNDSQRRHTFIIKHLFTDKLLAPVGVFDFPAQPRRFAVIVIGDPFERTAIGFQRNKGVHHRPQAVTVNGQDDFLNLLLFIAHQINFGNITAAFDTGRVLTGVQL